MIAVLLFATAATILAFGMWGASDANEPLYRRIAIGVMIFDAVLIVSWAFA